MVHARSLRVVVCTVVTCTVIACMVVGACVDVHAQDALPRLRSMFGNNDRLYFGIAPNIAGIDSCVVEATLHRILSFRNNKVIDTLQFTVSEWELLHRYLSEYEQFSTFRQDLYAKDIRYLRMQRSIIPANSLSAQHHVVSVATRSDTITGVILARSDRNVILGTSADLFTSLDAMPRSDFHVVPFSEIIGITRIDDGTAKGWIGTRTDSIASGVLNTIALEDAFTFAFPPEIRSADTGVIGSRTYSTLSVASVIGRSKGLRVDLGGGFGLSPIYPSVTTVVDGWEETEENPEGIFSWETSSATTSFFVANLDILGSLSDAFDVGGGFLAQIPFVDEQPLDQANVSRVGWVGYSVYAACAWYLTRNDVFGYQPLEVHIGARLGSSFITYRHQTIVGGREGSATRGVDMEYPTVQLFLSADYNMGYWITSNFGIMLHLGALANVGGSIPSDPQFVTDDVAAYYTYDVSSPSLTNMLIQGGATLSWRF